MTTHFSNCAVPCWSSRMAENLSALRKQYKRRKDEAAFFSNSARWLPVDCRWCPKWRFP